MSQPFPLLALCASLAATLAVAAADAPARALTLADALELTAERHPRLQARPFTLDAAAARRDQAARTPTFVLSAEADNFAGSGSLSGTVGLETTLRLSRALELGGKRDARIAVAEVEAALAGLGEDGARIDLLAETARRFLAVAEAQERLTAAREAHALAAAANEAVGLRAAAGGASVAERGRADIAAQRVTLAVEDAEHELMSARVSLAAMWDARALDAPAVSADLYALPTLESLDAVMARLDRNPALVRFATEARRADAQRRLAESARRPDLQFSAGLRRFEVTGDQGLVLGVSVPLGTDSRAAPIAREAEAERARLPLAEAGARAELYATLHAFYQEARQARNEAEAIRGSLLPRAREVVQFVEGGYRTGRYDFRDWSDAQRQWLELRVEGIQAAARCHALLIEIERLTGAIVPGGVPTKD